MTSKNYYANNHIITCLDSATDVYIKPGPGKTLHIDGVVTNPSAQGIDGSVQFNSLGDQAGDSSFLYDTINNVLTIPTVNTQLVERIVDSNSLDYNEIYLGPSEPFPAVVGSTHAETNYNFGYDAQISPNENVIVYANPHYVLGGSGGGLDPFSLNGTVYDEYSLPLIASNFTLEQTANSGSISDDGGGSGNVYATLCDNSQVGYVYLFKRTSGVWAELSQNNDLVYHQAKITHIGSTMTMLSVDRLSAFSISEITSGGVFNVGLQTLYDGGNFSESYRPIAIHQFWCLINADGNTMYYNKIGSTWTLVTTVSGAVNDLDVFTAGVQTAYVSVLAKSTGLTIKTFWGTQTFSGNYTACACTDAYVFGYNATSGAIEVYGVQLDQSFVKSVNDTIISGVNKMSCNYGYLTASQTSDNQASIYKIQDYTNHNVELIKISLDPTTQKVEITSPEGVTISDDLTVTGTLITTPNAALSPEIQLSTSGSGFHYSTNNISTLINYTEVLDVNENFIKGSKQYRSVDGSVTSPGLSFTSDVDSGIYRIGANNLGLSLNGVKQIDYATTGTTFTNKIIVPSGSVASPSVSIGSADTGIFKNTNTLSLVTDGVTRLGADFLHIVPTVPIRPLNNGTAATPSYSFVNYQDAGMFASSTGIDISVAGVRQFEVSSGGYSRCDSFTGLTTQTNFLNMGGSTISLLNSGETKVQYGQGGNSAANCSMGHNCSLVSENASLGCVLKIESTGIGRVGIEQSVTSSATIFQTFYATITPVGSVSTNGTTTSYNTTSSRLLKKDINLMDTSTELDRINLLRPSKYKWISNDAPGESFIADELEELFPDCVVGTDTEINGRMDYKQVDTTHLIASLVSAVQELSKQNDLMKLRMDAMQAEIDTFV